MLPEHCSVAKETRDTKPEGGSAFAGILLAD